MKTAHHQHHSCALRADSVCAELFFLRVGSLAYPLNFYRYIEGHRELVWDRLNEVIDNRINGLVEEHKQHMMEGQMKRIKNAIYAKLWFDDDVDSLS